MITRTVSTRLLSNKPRMPPKKVDCAVYGCGLGASGALAIPQVVRSNSARTSTKEVEFAKRIPFFNTEGIRQITSGFGFSLFASEHELYGAGLNNRFQIGGQLADKSKFQDYYISAKKIALPVPRNHHILEISSGRAHSLILTTAGVFAIGDNNFGQCGVEPTLEPHIVGSPDKLLESISPRLHPRMVQLPDRHIVSVHCSMDTSFLVDSDGIVWAFGLNADGQCGNGHYGISWNPQPVTGDVEGVKITRITGSTDTILAHSADGEVFIWGQTEYLQAAGVTDEIQLNTSRSLNLSQSIGPIVSSGATSSSVIVQNQRGEVFVWGVGVLGMGPETERLKAPTLMDRPLFDGKEVTRVFAGNSNMAATNSTGRLFVWGENRFSSLGLNHSKRQLFPYKVFVPGDVKSAALGPDHSLFLVN